MTESHKLPHIDFDQWSELARRDPETFEQLRSRMLDTAISQATGERQLHLRRLQWRIDQIRDRTGTPLAACIKISGLMWDTFSSLNSSYRSLSGRSDGAEAGPLPCRAKVIPIRSRNSH